MTRNRRSWPWWRWVLTGLNVLALVLSGYLSWHFLRGGSVIGCGAGSRCEEVLSSRWSAIGGVMPVSGLAAGAYLAILVASFYLGPETEASVRRLAWRAMLVLTGAAAGSAIYFTIVQKWVIGAFCPYCMATHVTGLFLAALVIWQAPRQLAQTPVQPPETPRRVIGRFPAIGMSLTGVVLSGIMAACQAGFMPRNVYRAGEAQATSLPTIDLHTVPLIGSPNARYVVDLLFDYKCPHCQQLHVMLDDVVSRYDGQVAFALCPAPLNPECNPYVTREVDEFTNSCELVKVALAVWVARRDAFFEFDRWMFSPEPGHLWHPRSLEAATAKAIELVGDAKFRAAQTDPWIDRYLQSTIQIYGSVGGTAVPKLVLGQHWVTPEP